jgi:hypothetical protein
MVNEAADTSAQPIWLAGKRAFTKMDRFADNFAIDQ